MDIFSKKINFKKKENKIQKIENYHYDIDESLESVYTNNYNNIYLCLFYINKNVPILEYFLHKHHDKLEFISVDVEYNEINTICNSYIKNNFSCQYNSKGYKVFNNNMYIFFELQDNIDNNSGYWCIIDEMCNKKSFLSYPISNNVSDYFLNNANFIYLKNNDKLKIETPIVAFQSCHDILEFMYSKYNYSKKNEYNDYDNINKKYILRYILFIRPENIIFGQPYQYKINYNCKPKSVHENNFA